LCEQLSDTGQRDLAKAHEVNLEDRTEVTVSMQSNNASLWSLLTYASLPMTFKGDPSGD